MFKISNINHGLSPFSKTYITHTAHYFVYIDIETNIVSGKSNIACFFSVEKHTNMPGNYTKVKGKRKNKREERGREIKRGIDTNRQEKHMKDQTNHIFPYY